jgi:hypothetical protein
VKVCQQDDHDRVLGGNGQVGVDFTGHGNVFQ